MNKELVLIVCLISLISSIFIIQLINLSAFQTTKPLDYKNCELAEILGVFPYGCYGDIE